MQVLILIKFPSTAPPLFSLVLFTPRAEHGRGRQSSVPQAPGGTIPRIDAVPPPLGLYAALVTEGGAAASPGAEGSGLGLEEVQQQSQGIQPGVAGHRYPPGPQSDWRGTGERQTHLRLSHGLGPPPQSRVPRSALMAKRRDPKAVFLGVYFVRLAVRTARPGRSSRAVGDVF